MKRVCNLGNKACLQLTLVRRRGGISFKLLQAGAEDLKSETATLTDISRWFSLGTSINSDSCFFSESERFVCVCVCV